MVPQKLVKPITVIGTVGAAMTPALAFAEGETADVSGITTAITGAATTVQTSALSMITQLLPVLAPILAAMIIVRIGWNFVSRYGGKSR